MFYGRPYLMEASLLIPICIAGGNALKNIFQIPRPYHVDMYFPNGKQKQDHGLPSTHTIAQFVIPLFSFYYFYIEHASEIPNYIMGTIPMLASILLWSTSVIASRIYLAYHNPIDVMLGLVVGVITLVSYTAYVRFWVHSWVMTSGASVFFSLLAVGISLVRFHPRTEPETPALAESGLCIGTGFGVLCGYWVNTHLAIRAILPSAVFPIMELLGPLGRSIFFFHLLRIIVGFSFVALVRSGSKSVVKRMLLHFGQQKSSLAEALGKFFCYFCISFTVVVLSRFPMAVLGLSIDSDLRPLTWVG